MWVLCDIVFIPQGKAVTGCHLDVWETIDKQKEHRNYIFDIETYDILYQINQTRNYPDSYLWTSV
jgi:hypothetical protein